MTDLVRNTLGFKDSSSPTISRMGALKSVGEATAGLRAFEAGADYLLFRFDEAAQLEAHRLIADAVRSAPSRARGSTNRSDGSSTRSDASASSTGGATSPRQTSRERQDGARARAWRDDSAAQPRCAAAPRADPPVSPTNADISFFEGQPTPAR